MKLSLSLFTVAIGFAFLAGSVFNFFDHSQFTKVGPSLIENVISGFGLLWIQVMIFLLVFTAVHMLAGWLFAWSIQPFVTHLTSDRKQSGQLAFFLLLLGMLWMALEAAGRFPHSMLGQTLYEFSISTLGQFGKIVLGSLALIPVIAGIALRSKALFNWVRKNPAITGSLTFTIAIMLFTVGWLTKPDNTVFPVDPDRPHVVLVGIDGWRLDTLPRNGGPEGLMPFVEGFMDEAAVIEEAYTPLARTFPAWWSVFTGQFPVNHGARFNLVNNEFIRTQATLPRTLGEEGYYRLFAMDEFRFANIRKAHGFDQIVGPPSGAADFLLGSLNDTPLTNLLANHWISKYLFPFNHANRAAYHTYRPDSFDRLVNHAIARAPRQPLFLAAHFELPHWPFRWADGPTGELGTHPMGIEFSHYLETLRMADHQVASLFKQLEKYEILNNAIVVLLSDHGEAFPGENLVWTFQSSGRKRVALAGHGTDVLGLTQHQIPLAFRGYGAHQIEPGMRSGRASLADVYPTLAQWLGLQINHPVDGQSLLTVLHDDSRTIPEHPIALETGFNPSPSLAGIVDESTLIADGARHYRILTDGHLTLRPEYMSDLVSRKRRAVLLGDRIFALMSPVSNTILKGQISSRTLEEISAPEAPDQALNAPIRHFCQIFANDSDYFQGSICRKKTKKSENDSDSTKHRNDHAKLE